MEKDKELMENPATNGQKADFERTVVEQSLVEQPKPKFTLEDLEKRLSNLYDGITRAIKEVGPHTETRLRDANGELQELLAIVIKHKSDFEPIDINRPDNPLVQEELQTEKPEFYVVGVQLIENGKLVGTSLYTTVAKARKIKDACNKEFARLRVNHEAKLVNYPVF